MRKRQKPGNSHCSRICFFPIWSKRTSRSSISSRLRRSMKTSSRHRTSTKCPFINRLSLYVDSQTQQKEPMKPANLIDIIERSQARHALREDREPNNLQAVIGGAVARLGSDKNGRAGKGGFGVEKLRVFTGPEWDGAFWFAV